MTTESTAVAAQDRQRFNPAILQDSLRGGSSVATFTPSDFSGLLEVAKMMASSRLAVPKHLRENAGMCLSVAMVAYQNGFNPFLLASDTYVVNDVLAYGAKSIGAMVNNSRRLHGRLAYDLGGKWPARSCTVTGRIKGDNELKTLTIHAETITVRNSPLWKAQPDQQLIYYSTRAWSRVYMPEVLLGLMGEDEIDEYRDAPQQNTAPRPRRADFQPHEQSIVKGEIIDAETGEVQDSAGEPEITAADVLPQIAAAQSVQHLMEFWNLLPAIITDDDAVYAAYEARRDDLAGV